MKSIEIERKHTTNNKILYLAPVAIVFAVSAAYGRFISGSTVNVIFGSILILFSFYMLLSFSAAIKRIRKKGPALIIDQEGISDDISLASAGFIHWDDINRYEILKSGGHPQLFLFVKDSGKYLKNLSGLKRRMLIQLEKDHGSSIAINFDMLQIERSVLIELLDNYNPKIL